MLICPAETEKKGIMFHRSYEQRSANRREKRGLLAVPRIQYVFFNFLFEHRSGDFHLGTSFPAETAPGNEDGLTNGSALQNRISSPWHGTFIPTITLKSF